MNNCAEYVLTVDQKLEINQQFYYPKSMAIVLGIGVASVPFIIQIGSDRIQYTTVWAMWLVGGIAVLFSSGMYWYVNRKNIARIRRSDLIRQTLKWDERVMVIESGDKSVSMKWDEISRAVILRSAIILFTKSGIYGLPKNSKILAALSSGGCKLVDKGNA
jgi:hypothetical protein